MSLLGSGHALCHAPSYLADAAEDVREERGAVVMVSGSDGRAGREEVVGEGGVLLSDGLPQLGLLRGREGGREGEGKKVTSKGNVALCKGRCYQ